MIGVASFFVAIILLLISRKMFSGKIVIQIYIGVIVAYLNIFPAADFILSGNYENSAFALTQFIVVICFELPLFFVLGFLSLPTFKYSSFSQNDSSYIRPSLLLPWLVILNAVVFWYVAINYDLLFRRIGHDALQEHSSNVPGALLYIYRGAVETSFFLVMLLISIFRNIKPDDNARRPYAVAIIVQLATFCVFFGINSRMQFLMLFFCLICILPTLTKMIFRGVSFVFITVFVVALITIQTYLRELFEGSQRVLGDDLYTTLLLILGLVAGRLNSMSKITELLSNGFDPIYVDLSGIGHIADLYASFFIDYGHYLDIKQTLVTSPSVVIVNKYLATNLIDFPRCMVVDLMLSFGIWGVIGGSLALGFCIWFISTHISGKPNFKTFVISIYILPFILEFEKDSMSLIITSLKWSPFLIIAIILRPKKGLSLNEEVNNYSIKAC